MCLVCVRSWLSCADSSATLYVLRSTPMTASARLVVCAGVIFCWLR